MTFIGRVSKFGALAFALAACPLALARAQGPTEAQTQAEDDAQLAELLGEEGASTVAEPRLKLYGFADFNAFKWMRMSDKWRTVFPEPLSFYVGKVNVYMEGNIAPAWKSLIEVRYMFVPNGANVPNGYLDPIGTTGRYNGVAADYTEIGRPVDWGGINIQRAYLEHNFNNFLSIRVGRFLTPWGIWNVDHGSPVIIGTAKPYVIGENFFPEAQTGLDAFGSVPLGESTLGYHLTLSNGRGPTEAFQDLDGNKAIGGRLSLKMYRLGQMEIGVSGYGGTVTDQRQQANPQTGSLSFFAYEHYRELSWAFDFRWMWDALHFQAEAALHDRVWDDDARPVTDVGLQADVRRFGVYALLGYRLPWRNVMPYLIYSFYDTGSRAAFGGTASKAQLWSPGLNIRINPSVVFKIEFQHATFSNVVPGSVFEDSLRQLSSQLAWEF